MKLEYVNMIEAWHCDPTKVTCSTLENAASVAAMILTTEAVVGHRRRNAKYGCRSRMPPMM